ncbi:hypothetical protein HB860_21460 [Aeromonas sp. 3925]|uniref:hypothetical protein n=1 Tax=Aeromonas genomosp. paramedia TaxID=3086176 RepID=UPI001FFD31C8|nr:hypothetical protein [Aeromonas genomosp. paramedia]MCK2086486.1 hypothetical protein [Aeromonas genomosp. paramedia]
MKSVNDNGLSRYRARLLIAALLACCSGAATAGVDDVWAASPATQDTQWAQANLATVIPVNNGAGLQWGAEEVHNGVNYYVDINTGGIGRCPDGYVLVGLMDTGDFKYGRGKRDHHELLCRKLTVR